MVKAHIFQSIILSDMQEMSLFQPWLITATSMQKKKDGIAAQNKSYSNLSTFSGLQVTLPSHYLITIVFYPYFSWSVVLTQKSLSRGVSSWMPYNISECKCLFLLPCYSERILQSICSSGLNPIAYSKRWTCNSLRKLCRYQLGLSRREDPTMQPSVSGEYSTVDTKDANSLVLYEFPFQFIVW